MPSLQYLTCVCLLLLSRPKHQDMLVGSDSGSPNCNNKNKSSCGPGQRNDSLSGESVLTALSQPLRVTEKFIDGVGVSAEKNGVSVMWCMSFPNILMYSTQYASMTHARGSDDSHPPNTRSGFPSNNWVGFGGESTFLWAIGLWPFKVASNLI